AALTEFIRGVGDTTTRLDRIEPGLNEGLVGDPRNTTTPAAMLGLWQRLLLGPRLSPGSRTILLNYLVGNLTGAAKLRAGLPVGWRVGDKTGSWSGNGTSNDVAIAWPPGRAPILIAVYLTGSTLDDAGRSGIIADVGRIVATL
ncbi:MAG: serine hydrolase, partial [Janthinobacterium lividum]